MPKRNFNYKLIFLGQEKFNLHIPLEPEFSRPLEGYTFILKHPLLFNKMKFNRSAKFRMMNSSTIFTYPNKCNTVKSFVRWWTIKFTHSEGIFSFNESCQTHPRWHYWLENNPHNVCMNSFIKISYSC